MYALRGKTEEALVKCISHRRMCASASSTVFEACVLETTTRILYYTDTGAEGEGKRERRYFYSSFSARYLRGAMDSRLGLPLYRLSTVIVLYGNSNEMLLFLLCTRWFLLKTRGSIKRRRGSTFSEPRRMYNRPGGYEFSESQPRARASNSSIRAAARRMQSLS